MSGYIQAGYLVTLLTLGGYGITLVVRERNARRRFARSDRSESTTKTARVAQEEPVDGEQT